MLKGYTLDTIPKGWRRKLDRSRTKEGQPNIMPSTELICAWRKWQHRAEPVANFRLKRTSVATYRIEFAIDHLASHIYSLGSNLLGHGEWNHSSLAAEVLVELEKISSDLETCAISETEKTEFREYIAVTRSLLQEMIRHGEGI